MYRLHIDKLKDAAARQGDTTRAAIFRRTGISESSVYRILSGESQPDLNSALRLAVAYGIAVEDLMELANTDSVVA
ncbi:helix-turn-helix transcriptional regulator [Streptomyces sp. ISL-98]|uniref:helix-turn-helix domain-containing protein n=1 Tax=Streptomyces sp. ISL-98 TaxID=2819192 RepID=UPI001BE909D5|nr:helix-turn-helix transcriptional regulator [Streptomyces sp. ISL-98]MBT2505112.1 helix-turn-helix transcriptional regulator [Streptomyces sp. ISL-98]